MSEDRDTVRTGPKAGDPETTYHTRWDMVNRAKSGGSDKDSVNALEELCRIYRHPIYIALRHKPSMGTRSKNPVCSCARNGARVSPSLAGEFERYSAWDSERVTPVRLDR